jgi:hypothetical protein
MARYLVATHEATQTHDWLCSHCHAAGHATVHARGEGERRLWFSRDTAAEVAHDRAAADLERDARRICSLIPCPSCGRRAPGAVLATGWYGFKDLAVAVFAGAIVGILTAGFLHTPLLASVLGTVAFVGLLAIGQERRRWREAANADLHLVNARTSQPARAAPRMTAPPAGPFRSPPAPPVIVTERPLREVPVPIVEGDPSDKPTFLR